MPTIDAKGDTLSYTLAKGKDSGIWLINKDGREKRLLVSVEGSVLKLSWSPNGLELAFIVKQVSYQIFKISKYGGDIRPLSRAYKAIERFEWFNNEWVLHDGYENGKWGVWLSKTDDVYLRLNPYDIDAKHPSLLKEASIVAMSVKYNEGYKITAYNLSSGGWTRLTFGNGDDFKSLFSPDGENIAYLSNRTGRWSIWVRNINTNSELDLTAPFSEKRYPRWSPAVDLDTTLLWSQDSKHLIFDGRRGDSREIYMMNLSGGAVTLRGAVKEYFPLTFNVLFEGATPFNLVLNPTGTSIYFENKEEKESSIWRFDLSVRRTTAYG